MFRELFLTPQQQKKIQFFKLMEGYPEGTYSVNTLSQKFKCNYQSFLQMLRELNESLIELKENHSLWRPRKFTGKVSPVVPIVS